MEATHKISVCYYPYTKELELTWENIDEGTIATLSLKDIEKETGLKIQNVVWPCVYSNAIAKERGDKMNELIVFEYVRTGLVKTDEYFWDKDGWMVKAKYDRKEGLDSPTNIYRLVENEPVVYGHAYTVEDKPKEDCSNCALDNTLNWRCDHCCKKVRHSFWLSKDEPKEKQTRCDSCIHDNDCPKVNRKLCWEIKRLSEQKKEVVK